MSHLLDSNIVLGCLKGRQAELEFIDSVQNDWITISIITYGEIYEGIYFGSNPHKNENNFLAFLQWVDVLPLDQAIMQRYAMLRGHLRRTGQLIGDSDTLIAATALHHNLTLVTRNVRHFARVPALRLAAL